MNFSTDDFGDNFRWGVSTAAHQIEGAAFSDGKGPSIWDEFVKRKGKIQDRSRSDVSCDHYGRYKEDIGLIGQLHIPNYRMSLSWSRLLPNGIGQRNQKGIDFYHRVIDECLEKNIEPWITLYHWDLPQALQAKGGWVNREILNWFEEYVTLCARQYGDRVKHWMVLNEPMVFTGAGYFLGYHAPGLKGLDNFLPAMHHAALCQSLGGRVVRSEVVAAKIGSTFSCSHIDPKSDSQKDVQTATRFDALLNRLFLEPALGLGYPLDDLPIASRVEKYMAQGDESRMAFDFDFIGIQNYTREVVKHTWYIPYLQGEIVGAKSRGVATTTMGWEVYPKSIYNLLHKFNKYENVKEIVITENGAAFPDQIADGRVRDQLRINFLNSYVGEVLNAKKEGVNVTGYFLWTLLDNFEWAEGYTQRFGIVHVDFKTLRRTIKDSGYWYSRFLMSPKHAERIDIL
ncbi:MAG: GH1 family beta-glucosidase [Cyclobacteriaceae bacterium]